MFLYTCGASVWDLSVSCLQVSRSCCWMYTVTRHSQHYLTFVNMNGAIIGVRVLEMNTPPCLALHLVLYDLLRYCPWISKGGQEDLPSSAIQRRTYQVLLRAFLRGTKKESSKKSWLCTCIRYSMGRLPDCHPKQSIQTWIVPRLWRCPLITKNTKNSIIKARQHRDPKYISLCVSASAAYQQPCSLTDCKCPWST